MWFKVFVLVRIPFSALCLLGFGQFGVWSLPGLGCMGLFMIVFLLFILAYASVKMFRLRPDGLNRGSGLVIIETIGVFQFVGARELEMGRNYGYVLAWAVFVLLLWTAPNALVLYKARSLFTEPAKEKPGK